MQDVYVLTLGEFVKGASFDLEQLKAKAESELIRHYSYTDTKWQVAPGEEAWNRVTLFVRDARTNRWNKTNIRVSKGGQ